MTGLQEREEIWRKAFPVQIEIDPANNWHQIATRYELSGAGIINVAHYCALEVLESKVFYLSKTQLGKAITREYIKEGRVV